MGLSPSTKVSIVCHPVSSRRRRQRGNVYAETALVLMPFFALVLGILDFGMAIFVRSTIQSAVAAGVRYAVTYQTISGYGMDDSVRLTTQIAALGFLGSTSTPNTAITVNYYNPTSGLSTPLSGSANIPFNIVEVSANYQWNWFSNLSGTWTPRSNTPLNIIVYSSDRLGGLPPGQSPPTR
jgi:Flp pilus assembly protein TadG